VITGDFYKYEDVPDPTNITMFDQAIVERELAVNDVAIFLKGKLDMGYADPKMKLESYFLM